MVRHFALQKISLLRERGRPCLLRGHWLENWNVTGYSFGLHCLRPICRVFFSVMAVSFVSHRGQQLSCSHDDDIKCKHFPRYWPFVQGIPGHQWIPRTKGQRRRALMFYLFCAWINLAASWSSGRVQDSGLGSRSSPEFNTLPVRLLVVPLSKALHAALLLSTQEQMGTCEGRFVSRGAKLRVSGCILPRELRWISNWIWSVKTLWPGNVLVKVCRAELWAWMWTQNSDFTFTFINGGINNREAGDLRCHRTHHGVTVMSGNCVKEEGGRD